MNIQKGNGKTQILLLNIPAEGVPIFGNSKINIEDKVIETGIEIFKENIDAKPLHELQSEDWIERTSFPIGMNEAGIFFLDMPPNLPQNTEALSTNEATSNDTEGTSSAQNTPVAEKPKTPVTETACVMCLEDSPSVSAFPRRNETHWGKKLPEIGNPFVYT